jgi:MFS transporter, SP family, xylose:H+ symportor
VIFRTLGGIGVGAASMAVPMYIAEIAPPRIRGKMVSINQLAIVTGMLTIYFVNYLIARTGDEAWNIAYGWRWMFGSELIPALLFLVLLLRVPESPRWLTEKGRSQQALDILSRLNGKQQAALELNQIEEAIEGESSSLAQLVRSGASLVLVIGISLAVLQQVTGINVFLYYAPQIFKKIGSGTEAAFLQTITIGAVNLGFTVIAIHTVDRWGRRPLMLLGASGMGICLFCMGLASYWQRADAWLLVLIVGFIACFALSIGPVTWVILSEIFPTKVRGRALGLCTFCLWSANFVVSQTFPMMNENAWLIGKFNHAFPFWVYGLLCLVEIVFVWRMVPETKGKSLEDIERSLTRRGRTDRRAEEREPVAEKV